MDLFMAAGRSRADRAQALTLTWLGADPSVSPAGLPMTGCSALPAMQCAAGVPPALVRRGLLSRDRLVTRTLCSPGPRQPRGDRPEEEALQLPQRLAEQGRALGRRLQQRAAAKASAWWERYEEFVGLSEVREAQGNVAEVRGPGGRAEGGPLTGNRDLVAPAKHVASHVQVCLFLKEFHSGAGWGDWRAPGRPAWLLLKTSC